MNEEIRNNIVQSLKEKILSYEDFPKPGIVFRDIFSLLNDAEASSKLRDLICDHVKSLPSLDCVVALDARGFIFGTIIALEFKIPFVPIRKAGKLPGELITTTYQLEYGQDKVQLQKESIKPGAKVLIVDDLLATGGTLQAACNLMKMVEAEIIECLVIMELTDLNARKAFNVPIHSFIQF